MNILNKLTIKHLCMNKKRTLVTIIGITLSCALMVGIGLLVSSFLYSERVSSEKVYGSYHAYFEDLSRRELDTIEKNVTVDKTYYFSPIGFAKFDTGAINKPYIYVTEASKSFLDTFNLIEGRLPQDDSEIIITKYANGFTSGKLSVGDTLELDIGERISEGENLGIAHNYAIAAGWETETNEIKYAEEELNIITHKTYKIVGMISDGYFQEYNSAGLMVFSLNNTPRDINNMFIEFKNPSDTYDNVKNIINNVHLEGKSYKINNNLLYYYGETKYSNVNETFLPLILIALTVISIGCIVVIYNSFAISTMERKKSFGLYASIGATMKQIRHTVLFEAFIVGVIGIVLGILGGFLGIFIVVKTLNHLLADILSMEVLFHVEPLYLIIPLIFMVIVIFVSAYFPAKRSSKVSPIEAIRGNDDIKISKKDVKTPKIIRKIFGIEGEIAHKNIKRNKKKYRVTVIALFISIVMFNTFTTFLSYIVKGSDTVDYYDYDIGLSFTGKKEDIYNDMKTVKNKYKLTKSLEMVYYNYPVKVTNLTDADYTKDFLKYYSIDGEGDNIDYSIMALSNEDYGGITNKEALLINSKYFTIYEGTTRKTNSVKVFNKNNFNIEFASGGSINATVTNEDIFGLKSFMYNPKPIIVMSIDTFERLFGNMEEYTAFLAISSKDYKKINDGLAEDRKNFASSCYYESPAVEMANVRNVILAVKILFYGFIALVTLIGVTSVINTINTSINLRRKEFAMLRSVGLSPRGFNKLLFFESLFFGLKSLLYGIPVSLGINVLISMSIGNVIDTGVILSWNSYIITIIGVFMIVLIAMSYATKKIKKENILEALREENI